MYGRELDFAAPLPGRYCGRKNYFRTTHYFRPHLHLKYLLIQQGTFLNYVEVLFIPPHYTPNVKNLSLKMPFTKDDFSKQRLPFTFTFFSTAHTLLHPLISVLAVYRSKVTLKSLPWFQPSKSESPIKKLSPFDVRNAID